MATTAAKAFDEFAANQELRPAQKQQVKNRRDVTESYLLPKFDVTSTVPLKALHIIGSAQRGTLIRPPNDVDLLAVFDGTEVWNDTGWFNNDGFRHDSTKLLYRVREALAGSRVELVGSRGQAVRLFYKSGGHVDVVPAFEADSGGYFIPAGNKKMDHDRSIPARGVHQPQKQGTRIQVEAAGAKA